MRGSGHWLVSLAERIVADPRVSELTVVNGDPRYEREEEFTADGVRYLTLPAGRRELSGIGWEKFVTKLRNAINRVSPDIVDVHGSEYAYGHVADLIDFPVVLTIQGLVTQAREHPFGDLSLPGVLYRQTRSLGDLKAAAGTLFTAFMGPWREASEKSILKKNEYFLGRTNWDKDVIHRLSPRLRQYHTAWRIERPVFYDTSWTGSSQNTITLFSCSRCNPQKGQHNLIATLPALRAKWPGIRLRLTADQNEPGWGRYLYRLAHDLEVQQNVDFLGYLSSERIASELASTSIYVHPTYQDNGPNSLAEAMLVGVPCIAADTAGIASMIEHEVSGMLVPTGDLDMLGLTIERLITDPAFARSLGACARARALPRHDPATVVDATISAYYAVISDWMTQHRKGQPTESE